MKAYRATPRNLHLVTQNGHSLLIFPSVRKLPVAQVLGTKLSADLSGRLANLNEKNVSFHEILLASCPDVDGDNDVAPAHDDTTSHDDVPPRDENEDNLLGDNHDDQDLFGERSSILPDTKFRSKFFDVSPLDTGSPRNSKRSRDNDDALFLNFLADFLSFRSTDNTRSPNSTSPKTPVSDEDTRDPEELVVADVTHDPPRLLLSLITMITFTQRRSRV